LDMPVVSVRTSSERKVDAQPVTSDSLAMRELELGLPPKGGASG
jgi:hypothetical protein